MAPRIRHPPSSRCRHELAGPLEPVRVAREEEFFEVADLGVCLIQLDACVGRGRRPKPGSRPRAARTGRSLRSTGFRAYRCRRRSRGASWRCRARFPGSSGRSALRLFADPVAEELVVQLPQPADGVGKRLGFVCRDDVAGVFFFVAVGVARGVLPRGSLRSRSSRRSRRPRDRAA